MQEPMRGDDAFATACRQLERCARINAEGVKICLELHAEEPDSGTERMAAESLAYALGQLRLLIAPMQLLALDAEMAAAKVEG